MTYQEKRLDRTIRRISTACSLSASVGFVIGFIGLIATMIELWLNEPYSTFSVAASLTGTAIIINATLIGRLISK